MFWVISVQFDLRNTPEVRSFPPGTLCITNIVPVAYEKDKYGQFGRGDNLRLCVMAKLNRNQRRPGNNQSSNKCNNWL